MSRPRWLTRREQQAWRGLLQMQREVGGRTARDLQRESGLSGPDYEVLVNLSEAPLRRTPRNRNLRSADARTSGRHQAVVRRRGLRPRDRRSHDARTSDAVALAWWPRLRPLALQAGVRPAR